MEERWKPITDYHWLYEVSDHGNIRRIANKRPLKKHLSRKENAYLVVALSRWCIARTKLVHRLVAIEFCGGYKEGFEVNHIDRDKTNNHFSNLEWVTHQDNINHSSGRNRFKGTKSSYFDRPSTKYRISYIGMGKTLNMLYTRRRESTEGPERDRIEGKIELLKIIRSELRGLINALD